MMRSPLLWALTFGALSLAAWGQATERYSLVFLRTSPDRKPIDKAEADRIQSAHMANILAMADRGVLVAAGPFEDDPPVIRGLFVFRVSSVDEARKIAEQDPTVVEHRNTVDAFSWTGPAGIGVEHRKLHTADPKMPQDMGVHPFCLLSLNSDLPGRDPLLQQHANYIAGLHKSGKLAAFGPSSGYGDVVETLIFSRIPDAEARDLINADPAVKAGLLKPEFHRWWSAAHVLP